MAKNLQLNGLIHAKYNTESEMAEKMGWSRQRLNKITNGRRMPDLFEVDKMAGILDTSFMDLANIFLSMGSTNVDKQ